MTAITLDQQLSPHFTLRELCASDTAARLHIVNVPGDPAILANLASLCLHVLEPLRGEFGPFGAGTGIDSGYRSGPLNDAVGGVKTSQHRTGQAVDVKLPRLLSVKDLALWCAGHLDFDQCIMEHTSAMLDAGWVHVSYAGTRNRRQRLTITTTGLTWPGFVEPKQQ